METVTREGPAFAAQFDENDQGNSLHRRARTKLQLGEIDEARKVFEQHSAVLAKWAAESDTLKVQYLWGAMAYGLAEIHARSKQWRRASDLYAESLAHFERVTASVTLDHMDRRPVEEAATGLARSKAEIAKLEQT